MSNLNVDGKIDSPSTWSYVETYTLNGSYYQDIPVDFTNYKYKMIMYLSKSGGTSNLNAKFIISSSIATPPVYWNTVSNSNTSSSGGTGSSYFYAYGVSSGSSITSYFYIDDYDNNSAHYHNIEFTIEPEPINLGGTRLIYKSRSCTNFASYWRDIYASGMAYDLSSAPSYIRITNEANSTSQYLYGTIKVYRMGVDY